ncbi:hypothetical protein QUC31_002387 [Theobroma cacao]
MSNEIVPVDPIFDEEPKPNKQPTISHGEKEESKGVTRSLTYGESSSCRSGRYVSEMFNGERLPPTLASEIQSFLRVANMLEWKAPRVAYLCKSFLYFQCLCFSFFFLLLVLG